MKSRTVIVTGGFGVLGSAVADAFGAAGDRVARVDHAAAPTTELVDVLDLAGVDLTDPAAALGAANTIVSAFGSIDVLVNVAGGFAWETLTEGSSATWARLFALNTQTCVNMTKAALPHITQSKSGRIINIGASGALSAGVGMGSYAASKSGVHRLTESLAAELAGAAITVNAVLPTIIDTPTNRTEMPDADVGSWVQPDAIAEVILFLASPAARAISGALIPLSRGG